jgi:polyisoprenoid-binding protein YceI
MSIFTIVPVIAALPVAAHAAQYDIDPGHSSASFSVRHLMISNVRGDLSGLKGVASWSKPDLSDAKIEVTIDASTIDTRNPARDKDLKSPTFFDVAQYPTLSFKSTRIVKHGDNLTISGDLTIHGVTRPVSFAGAAPSPELKDPFGNTRVGATVTTKINRKDYGLTWNKALETGGVVVGEEVAIEVNIELIKRAAPSK